MKVVKKIPSSYELLCPHCEETLPAPCGSLYWDVNEIHSGASHECPHCNKTVRMPKA